MQPLKNRDKKTLDSIEQVEKNFKIFWSNYAKHTS